MSRRARPLWASGPWVVVAATLLTSIGACGSTGHASGHPGVLTATSGEHQQVSLPAAAAPGTSRAQAPAASMIQQPVRQAAPACPSAYFPPDPHRPHVRLDLAVAADLKTVAGTETITFTPEAPVSELDFRLWPNGPEGGRTSGRLDVTAVRTPGGQAPRSVAAGARPGLPGTLLVVPLAHPAPPGQPVTATLDYVLHLPAVRLDRLGAGPTAAWWGSAHPVLAWVRGRGWVRDFALRSYGETQVSEAAALDLTVTAPADDVVLATGRGAGPVAAGARRRRWHFTAAAARDVAVAVGAFRTLTASSRAGDGRAIPVTVAALPGQARPLATMLAQQQRALAALVGRLGPFPMEALTAVDLPGFGDSGVEYPGLVFVGDDEDGGFTVTHETAHQWFYGLVGDDQARDPWLDEALATAEQAIVDNEQQSYARYLHASGTVGASLASFGGDVGRYFDSVYYKGAAAVLAARTAAGTARFDAAIKCYLRAQAWRVAAPADLGRSLTGLPAALTVLRGAGALPSGSARSAPTLAPPSAAPSTGS